MTAPFTLGGDGDLTINANNGTAARGISLTGGSAAVNFNQTGELTVNTTGTGISLLAPNDVVFANRSLTINAGKEGMNYVGSGTSSCTLPSGTIHAITETGVSASRGDLTVPQNCIVTSDNDYGIDFAPSNNGNTLTLSSDCDAVYLYENSTMTGSGQVTLLAERAAATTTATLKKAPHSREN